MRTFHTTTQTEAQNVLLHRANENYGEKAYCLGYKQVMGKLVRSKAHDGFYLKKDLKKIILNA